MGGGPAGEPPRPEADPEAQGHPREIAGSPAPEPAPPPAPEPAPFGRRLPAPGVLELEELLANHLNTRVKVDMGSRHGRIVIDFATLEDLERIYKLMVRPETLA